MADLAVEVATALATGAGDSLATKSIEAIGSLISALRARFRGDPGSRETLEIALAATGDMGATEDLISLLRERIAEDAGFAGWLEGLWTVVEHDLRLEGGRSINLVQGNVQGSVVQSRDVQGGIHIGHSDSSGASSAQE